VDLDYAEVAQRIHMAVEREIADQLVRVNRR
jgi:hypothetical protein